MLKQSTEGPAYPETKNGRGVRPGIAHRMEILTKEEIRAIAAASLRVLEQVGVKIEHQPALDLLRSWGADVEENLVRMPASTVEKALDSVPRRVTLHAREPRNNIDLGAGRVHFTNGFGATWIEDRASDGYRQATLADFSALMRLADALEYVDYCLFPVVPQDVPPRMLDIECTAAALNNTSKHVQLSLESAEWVDDVIEMARVVAEPGSPPPVSAGGVPNSPLHYSADVAAKFMSLARFNVPCFIVDGAMAGATAPVTLAGALTLQNAEVLAGVVLNQLAQPGAPVIYGTFTGGFDMRSMKLALGGPEVALISAATAQLAEFYGIPLGYATAGAADSNKGDLQCGIEKVSGLMLAGLAGVEVIHNAIGLLGGGMCTSPAQMVIDNDICRLVSYCLQGLRVDERSLAEEVIASVGPKGQYIAIEHTASEFRQALFLAPLFDRDSIRDRQRMGESVLCTRAELEAKQLIERHHPLPLSNDQKKAIEVVRKMAHSRIA